MGLWVRIKGELFAPDGLSLFDQDAHGASGTRHDLLGRLDVVGVEIGELGLGDLGKLSLRERAHLVALRNAAALLDAKSLTDENSRRRGLADEVDGLVLIDRDLDGDNRIALVLRLGS